MFHGRNTKKILLILLLALVCIGGTELVVCRFADPALYARITAPVRRGAAAVRDGAVHAGNLVWTEARELWDDTVSFVSRTAGALQRNEAQPLEDQAALEPDQAYLIPPAATAVTTLQSRPEGEVLTGGSRDILYFNQADPAWADRPYGSDTLGKYGCGPTTLAMVVSSLSDTLLTPEDAAQWAVDGGYWARHGGSYLSIVNGAAEHYGLEVSSSPNCTVEELQLALASGKMAVALMSPGHFTRSGHFILLRGVTLDGSILVADPNSRDRSLAVWEPQLILDELSKSRNNGAPLWFFSAGGSE